MTAAQNARKAARPLHWAIASAMPLTLRRHYLHAANTRRWGNFTRPTTYNDKMNWRILKDRRPQLVMTCDKLTMKDLARSLVPDEHELRIPKTYWSGSDIRRAPDLRELGPTVIKPNNGSGDVIFGPLPPEELAVRTHGWLRSKAGNQLGEWGYQHARELILIEERIPSLETAPVDYKFFVFDGYVGFIQANSDRFGQTASWSFYDPTWEYLPVGRRGYARTPLPPPTQLPEMIDLAKRLAAGWDHIRIDLYCTDEGVWFGEFSPYHHGGVFPFDPPGYDLKFGQFWTLPEPLGSRKTHSSNDDVRYA